MAATDFNSDRGSIFYPAMALLAVIAVLVGFSTTYFGPVASGQFGGPVIVHIHGGLFFSWMALMALQPSLIRGSRWQLHRKLGLVALPLAVAMAVSGIGVGLYAVRRDLAAGAGDISYSSLIGVLTAMAIFVAFVAAAIALRKRPAWHKRMVLLATIAILWPAWFRFRHLMPWVPRPDIWFAVVLSDSLILIAALRDQFLFGRVHPAYWFFGSALVVDHVAEVLLFDSPRWRAVARAIYSALG
jgi:hypothetical protein